MPNSCIKALVTVAVSGAVLLLVLRNATRRAWKRRWQAAWRGKWQEIVHRQRLQHIAERCRAERGQVGSPSKGGCAKEVPMGKHTSTPSLPNDVLVHIFVQLPLSSQLRAAAVCTDWRLAAATKSLYASIDRSLLVDLGRRIPRNILHMVAKRCANDATVHLNLRGVSGVDNALVERFTMRATSLQSIDLSACAVGDDALVAIASRCPMLERLRLWAVDEVTDEGIRALAQHGGAALQSIDLRACSELTGDAIASLVAACGRRLRELRLKGVSAATGDETLIQLGTCCPELTILDASGLRCTDDGLRALADGCPGLHQLFLSGSKRVGNAGVGAIAAGCGARLQLLDLQGCARVGDPAAFELAEHCPNLHTVSFQCCAGLTDAGFAALCDRCALQHVTLKHCKVSQDSILEVQRACPMLTVRTIASGPLQWETV
mmetsp:Transcript_43835/g.115196  ORF Transcript_43835/g.115196 Transcript_43835/m.115196 type:complete len:434 (+) Transcript_43835:989-2290(+)